MTEDWTKWESQVVNGAFPLRRFLGRSNHSVVFLTECQAKNLSSAAIKLIPADPALAEAQLSYWKTAATLSHPHLIGLLDAGRCRLGGHPFLFVVMEYADQNLAQILPHRALTPDEVREMLPPTLGALSFLHRKNLAQGQLRPSNLLVVNDQLKLASDGVRPVGEPKASSKSSVYDPPEANNGRVSRAGDIWSLGVTLVEALTQHLPAWPDQRFETATLPATLPAEFADSVRQCLSRNPVDRPTIAVLEARIKGEPAAAVVSAPLPAIGDVPGQTIVTQNWPNRRLLLSAIAAGLIALAAVWAGFPLFKSHGYSPQSEPSTAQLRSQQAASPAAAAPNPKMSVPAQASSVLHQEIPDVPRSARESIHGNIKVTVRVTVDPSGKVVEETLENRGSSKYFAHLATEAAKKWMFSTAANQDSRVWLLRFEFTRGGTTAHAIPRS